ncbi:molybdopterin molybdotransferase MoeA [Actinoplanes auranticolor]|uniref:Molybdopterin molybdenumtransferase n=1 Tax=Actinoplanes auranticolor TaxID=47988 RepID=A0A919S585_9ACTN|nr:molybdopterin molybdotransferase MoeA [Actinoplanes auranticolor]GIM64350.1 molybdopterin molybdenumtransferase MoeA [Actinoplanes auranticolor]
MPTTDTAATGWRAARRIAAGAATALPAEDVPLDRAVGRVLAAAVPARTDLPGSDTAAMDGYAVAGAGPWQVIGRILAGGPVWTRELRPGQAVEIMTGAVVPAGTVAVLPYETADLSGTTAAGKPHIRRAGEDARAGSELVGAGRLVTPAVAGLLAQAGADGVAVHRRPRVRLLVTGDEVVSAGIPAAGQVRDVFAPMVSALVVAAGAVLAERLVLRDDPGVLAERLAAPDADVVVVTGSSSAGAADHLHRVLEKLGAQRLVDRVACRPGGPQLLAALPGGRWVTGLPGNPFAGLVAAVTVLQPLLYALTGRPVPLAPRLPVRGDVVVTAAVTRLVPVRLAGDHAVVVPGSRPASLAGAAAADALAVLEDGWTDGSPADLIPLG